MKKAKIYVSENHIYALDYASGKIRPLFSFGSDLEILKIDIPFSFNEKMEIVLPFEVVEEIDNVSIEAGVVVFEDTKTKQRLINLEYNQRRENSILVEKIEDKTIQFIEYGDLMVVNSKYGLALIKSYTNFDRAIDKHKNRKLIEEGINASIEEEISNSFRLRFDNSFFYDSRFIEYDYKR